MALSKIDVANMLTGLVPNDNTIRRPNAQPLIINGNMEVAQRGSSAASKTSSGYYSCDRMKANINGIGTYTVAQESLTSGNAYNNGFKKAWRIDTTTADASPASTDFLFLNYAFEGQDLQSIKKGTSNAQPLTLSFWVKSNKTGNANANLYDNDNNRMCGGTYTINSADTWEQKVINYPADTTGAFDNDSSGSLFVEFWLDSGSNYTGGTSPTAWETRATDERNAANALQIARNTANDWAITGVQLEVGEFSSTTLPPFQHETFEENLFRCFRYYYYLAPATGFRFVGWCQMDNDDTNHVAYIDFKTHMRAAPSALEQSGTASHYKIREASTQTCDAVPTFNNADTWYAAVSFKKSSSGFSQGELNKVGIDGGYLAWSAEL